MLKGKTIRSGPNLGNISVAIRRPDYRQAATEITTVHIDGTEAIVSTGTMGLWNAFSEQFRIGNCRDATIAYDGSWGMVYNEDNEQVYSFYTIGEPYIAYVTLDNDLYIQQGNGLPTYICSGFITSISCIRGWRNIKDPTQDQGFIIAYVRDGKAYYRNYVKDETQSNWSNETLIPTEVDVLSVNVTRSIDYRVIFSVTTSDSRGHIFLTERCFSGLSVNNEHIQGWASIGSAVAHHIETKKYNGLNEYPEATVNLNSVAVKKLETQKREFSEYISSDISVSSETKTRQAGTKFNYFKVRNVSDSVIELLTDFEITYETINELRKGLLIQDAAEQSVFINNLTYNNGVTTLSVLPMTNLVEGLLTISYDSSIGTVLNQSGVSFDSFSYEFEPVGLINNGLVDTKISSIINVGDNTLVVKYDRDIMTDPDLETLLNGFIITGTEEEYINGPQHIVTYELDSVEKTGINEITLRTKTRFNNELNGEVTITYKDNLGNLLDINNTRVKSSITTIKLTDVIRKPNPNISEYVNCKCSMNNIIITPVGTIVP